MHPEISDYFRHYVNMVNGMPLIDSLKQEHQRTMAFMSSLPEDKLEYRYAEEKWTPKQIWIHVMDTERVFNYRALRFARKDKTPLPGYDHDLWVPASNSENRSLESLVVEWKSVRLATLALFEPMNDEILQRSGIANNQNFQVEDLGYIIAGHEQHHNNIIRERYL
jgi:hypothetical protein